MRAQAISEIAIVLTGSIGDIVRGFALLAPLKRQYAGVRISWVVDSRWRDLVALHPLVDRVIEFNRRDPLRSLRQIHRLARSVQFDLALDLQRIAKSAIITASLGAARKIGVNRANAKEFCWLFYREQIAPQDERRPKLELYLGFLKHLGVIDQCELESLGRLDFGLDRAKVEPSSKIVEQFGSLRSGAIGLVLGSSWQSKDWHYEGYLGVFNLALAQSSRQLVLIGDQKSKGLAEQLISSVTVGEGRVLNLAGETSLSDLVPVLQRCAVVVGPDSGPGHICGALNVPYVGLFGPTDIRRTAPYGSEKSSLRVNLGCAPCYRRVCPGVGQVCMRLISPARVWREVVSTVGSV